MLTPKHTIWDESQMHSKVNKYSSELQYIAIHQFKYLHYEDTIAILKRANVELDLDI